MNSLTSIPERFNPTVGGWLDLNNGSKYIDGTGGITEITSIDITANDGKLTMDALNLQQKVYNMLNRIAVSGGTYRD